jgi:hypothetical protein
MAFEFEALSITVISIASIHTITGPDHYLPFIALSKSRGWSISKTTFWTICCGTGHVFSSVLLGLIGASIGWSLSKLTWIEFIRGGAAGWALLLFGVIYFIWGLVRAYQNRAHKHFDMKDDGALYVFEHNHNDLSPTVERHKVTPYVMFVIFFLGPSEPMIPLLFAPAINNSLIDILSLILIYTSATIVTMSFMVTLGYYGFHFLKMDRLERYTHAMGGLAILICGIGMVFMEW